jgi:ElaB/YqjD/DUF883 family membrane-anchored ribosome-binding protein
MNNISNYSDSQSNGSTKDSDAIKNKAEKVMNNASSELHNFIADIEDLVKEATTLTGEDLKKAKAKLSERLSEAKESATEMGGVMKQRVRQSAISTNEYVHEQPWKAIGAGAAIGLLVGFAIARR